MGVLGFVALVGSGLVTLTLVVIALRQRLWSDGEPLSAQALVLGLGLALLPWSALAYWLAVATHHRPLGAVTFAVAATAGAVLAILVARHSSLAERARSRARVAALASCAALGAVGLGVVAARGVAADSSLRSAVPDLGLGLVLALLAAFLPLSPSLARLSRVALIGCICLWGVTLGLMRLEPDVRATVKSVPVIAGVVGLAVR